VGLVAVLAVVVCCLTPALVAGGVLVSLGHFLRHPVIVAIGVALILATVAMAISRVRRHQQPCWPPEQLKVERQQAVEHPGDLPPDAPTKGSGQ
jgi:hypothetical protein